MSFYITGFNLIDKENNVVISETGEIKFEALNGKNTYELNLDDIKNWLTMVDDIDPATGKCRVDLETGEELCVYVPYNKPVTGEVIFTLDLDTVTGKTKFGLVKNTCNINLVSFEMEGTQTNMGRCNK